MRQAESKTSDIRRRRSLAVLIYRTGSDHVAEQRRPAEIMSANEVSGNRPHRDATGQVLASERPSNVAEHGSRLAGRSNDDSGRRSLALCALGCHGRTWGHFGGPCWPFWGRTRLSPIGARLSAMVSVLH
jgi:hypothetical protein